MLAQRQIMVYSTRDDFQKIFVAKHWAGAMTEVSHDYLLWADANLGALKTDASISRVLSYELRPDGKGKYIAKVKMAFNHKGVFDWRTSRYRDYARVYVPIGSKLIKTTGAMKTDRSTEAGRVDQGVENGRQWFGAFISIEPGNTGELSFEYYVAPQIAQILKNNSYRLLVQKQLGTNNTGLTLSLIFDKNLAEAVPGEDTKKHGDNRYEYTGTLKLDSNFEIRTQ